MSAWSINSNISLIDLDDLIEGVADSNIDKSLFFLKKFNLGVFNI